jgi:hypothetical protein
MLSAAQISLLVDRPDRWARRGIRSGRFGPIVGRIGKADLVAVETVEAATGLRFSRTQLAAAGVITDREEDHP